MSLQSCESSVVVADQVTPFVEPIPESESADTEKDQQQQVLNDSYIGAVELLTEYDDQVTPYVVISDDGKHPVQDNPLTKSYHIDTIDYSGKDDMIHNKKRKRILDVDTDIDTINLERDGLLDDDDDNNSRYRFTSVLITGGCGFIASNLINHLVEKYPNVLFINVDCLYYSSSEKNITVSGKDNYKFYKGSILDEDLIAKLLRTYKIDTVLHFAAKTHVDESFEFPRRYVENNVLGTFCLLEECRKYGDIKRFFHMSTDEVYGDNLHQEEEIMTESSGINPTNPYSATKAAAEVMVTSYHISFKLPVIVVRCNNVYGESQHPEKLIPKFIDRLTRGEKCTIHGSGNQSRVFIYIQDAIRAYELILLRGTLGEKYNIGSTEKYSVLQVTRMLIHKIILQSKLDEDDDNKFTAHDKRQRQLDFKRIDEWIQFIPDRAYNDLSYNIAWEKIQALGWKPTVSLDEGLDKVIQWYSTISMKEHWPIYE